MRKTDHTDPDAPAGLVPTTSSAQMARRRELVADRQRQRDEEAAGLHAKPPPPWEEAVKAYLDDCRRRRLSAGTIEQYRGTLTSDHTETWRTRKDIRTVASLTVANARALREQMVAKGLKPATIVAQQRRLHAFGLWCQQRYGVGGAIADVEQPILREPPPRTYTNEQVARILQACSSARDQLLIETLLATGLRASEVCQLRVADMVQAPDGRVWLNVGQGRGREGRLVPLDTFDKQVSKRLRLYVAAEFTTAAHSAPLFQLTYDGLKSIMYRLNGRTGIDVKAEVWRHTFAVRAVRAGVDASTLQRILGFTTKRRALRYLDATRPKRTRTGHDDRSR